MLEFIKNKGKSIMMAYGGAACGGQIKCLDWLKKQDIEINNYEYKNDLGFRVIVEAKNELASLGGLKWIHKNISEYFSKEKWMKMLEIPKIREWIDKYSFDERS